MNTEITKNESCSDLLLDTAQLAALIVLESGGETSRAEEIATIICRSGGRNAEAIAFPTGIFITLENGDEHKTTSVARIKERGVNLHKVERANAFSREFSSGSLSLCELNEKLTKLRSSVLYTDVTTLFATALSAGAFTVLFEQTLSWITLVDLLIAFLASLASQSVMLFTRIKYSYQFSRTFLSSSLTAILSILIVKLIGAGDLNYILIGSIFPLLPGLSLTNAVRDTVMGDIVSGTVRIVEAMLIAIAIAGGVGIVLAAYVSFFGGAL